jgi:hypothetical protein
MGYHATAAFESTPTRSLRTAYPRFARCEAGFRFFLPEIGRWLARDPIGEWGGVRVYGFSANAPINHFDAFWPSLYDHSTLTWAGATRWVERERWADCA